MASNESVAAITHTMPTDDDPKYRAGSYTPLEDDDVSVDEGRVDIGFFCDTCTDYIDLRMLQEHRTYHRALATLKYKGEVRPETVEALTNRRRALLRRMKKAVEGGQIIDTGEVQRVNEAYELLKAYLQDSYDANRRLEEAEVSNIQGSGLNCTCRCVYAVGVCTSQNEKWKSEMEDRIVYQDCYGNDPHKAFLGMFDGHHGAYAAETVSTHLHHELLRELQVFDPRTKCTCTYNMAEKKQNNDVEQHSRMVSDLTGDALLHTDSTNMVQQVLHICQKSVERLELEDEKDDKSSGEERVDPPPASDGDIKRDPYSEKMATAFKRAYKFTDKLLGWGKNERSRVRWSGCSAVTCVIQENKTAKELLNSMGTINNRTLGITSSQTEFAAPQQIGTLFLANAGHTKAVLMRGNRIYTVTQDHTSNNTKEKDRVLKLGGNVTESETEVLINGVVPATRGLGNHGDPKMKQCISMEPYTCAIPIDQYAQVLIIASQGVWQVLSEQEAVKITLQHLGSVLLNDTGLPQFQVPRPRRISGNVIAILKQQQRNMEEARSKKMQRQHSESTLESEPIKEEIDLEVGDETKDEEVLTMGNQDADSDGEGRESGLEGDIESLADSDQVSVASQKSVQTVEKNFAQILAKRLVQAATLAGSKENISVMVVLLPGYQLG